MNALEECTSSNAPPNGATAIGMPEWLPSKMQQYVGDDEVSLLTRAKNLYFEEAGELLSFDNHAIRLRTLEELLAIKNQGLVRPADHGFMFDRAKTLATDWMYIRGGIADADLQQARKQFQELVEIAKRLLSDHLDQVNAAQAERDDALDEFQAVVHLGLSYFETPRVAALADALTGEQLASAKLELYEMLSVSLEDRARQLHEYETAPARPEMGKQLNERRISNGRKIRLAMDASLAASIPFQIYLLESTQLENPQHPASLIAPLGGISVGKISYDGRDLFAISYFFEAEE